MSAHPWVRCREHEAASRLSGSISPGVIEITGFQFPSRFVRCPKPYAYTDQHDQGYKKDGKQQLHLDRLVCLRMRFMSAISGITKTATRTA